MDGVEARPKPSHVAYTDGAYSAASRAGSVKCFAARGSNPNMLCLRGRPAGNCACPLTGTGHPPQAAADCTVSPVARLAVASPLKWTLGRGVVSLLHRLSTVLLLPRPH